MQNKPTVLIATGTMNAGGTETLIMEILRHQTGRVRNVLLLHYQGHIQEGMFDDEIKALGVEMLYIPSVGDLGIRGYCRKFKEVVCSLGRVDIIHSHLNASGGVICMAAKMAGIKHRICHCHADIRFKGSRLQNLKSEILLQLQRLLFVNRYANHFWACSHEAWRRLFYPWKNEVVIPNMIDVEKYLSTKEQKVLAKAAIGMDNKFIVGSIGRVARIKNYELAIKAIAQLNDDGVEIHFVCYGRFDADNDAYCQELLQLAEDLNIVDKVHFMGNTANVACDIKAFDVFLMPSTTEGFGMAAIEAQAAGIPTLLSVGIPHVVDVELDLVKFLPLKPELWAKTVSDELAKIGNLHPIDHDLILSAFNKCGYNSVTMVREIENKYLDICHLNKH